MISIKYSIKHRVFVILGVSTILLSLAYAALTIVLVYAVEDETLDKLLALEAKHIESVFSENGEIVQPRASYMSLYLDTETLPDEIRQSLIDSPRVTEVFTKDEKHYHIRHLYLDGTGDRLLVADVSPLLSVTNLSREMLIIFLGVFAFALAAGVWFAYRITLVTVRPIVRLAQDVENNKSTQEKLDLSGSKFRDEIGFLSQTIETALNELRDLIKREKDFNRDLSHELRTPLTILTNTLSLASTRPLTHEDVEHLKQNVQGISQTVDILLALARSESIRTEAFPVRPIIEDCVLSLHQKNPDSKFEVNLHIDDRVEACGNRQLATLLVNNLIENAMTHAAEKRMTIRLTQSSSDQANLVFENSIDQQVATDVTDPYIKRDQSPGLGQGLYLVSRVIEAMNWEFEIVSDETSYQFTLKFRTSLILSPAK